MAMERGTFVGFGVGLVVGAGIGALVANAFKTHTAAGNPVSGCVDVPVEPDDGWEETYANGFTEAMQDGMQDPEVLTYDEAVVFVMDRLWPGSSAAAANPSSPTWLTDARGAVREELGDRLGATAVEARVRLAVPAGVQALRGGSGRDGAVLEMATRAFPEAQWRARGERLAPWQQAFIHQARTQLSAFPEYRTAA